MVAALGRAETEGSAVGCGVGGEEIDAGSVDGLLAAVDVAADGGAGCRASTVEVEVREQPVGHQ